jgi:hypothetical protein
VDYITHARHSLLIRTIKDLSSDAAISINSHVACKQSHDDLAGLFISGLNRDNTIYGGSCVSI